MSMKTIFAATAALALSAGIASATTLDFDTGTAIWQNDDPTTNNLIGYEQDGLLFSITFLNPLSSNAVSANLFASHLCEPFASCNGNDDGDLVPGSAAPGAQGDNGIENNLLIVQEDDNHDGTTLDDDDVEGGSIMFTLQSGPAFSILGFSGIDGATFSIATGAFTDGFSGLTNGQTGLTTFAAPSPLINVGDNFTVTIIGSGAIDSIVLAPIPLPAGGLLLLAGLGGLAAARRRKTA